MSAASSPYSACPHRTIPFQIFAHRVRKHREDNDVVISLTNRGITLYVSPSPVIFTGIDCFSFQFPLMGRNHVVRS